jgi:hypothetical protein
MVAVQNLKGEIIQLILSRSKLPMKNEDNLHVHISINNYMRKKKILNYLPFYILESKYPDVKRSIKILFHTGIVTLTSGRMYLVSTTPPKRLIGFK